MTTLRKIRSYGWRPQLPDVRDKMFVRALRGTILPPSVDLRPQCPPIYDQGQLGSCTANGIAAAIQFDQMKQNAVSVFAPSRLFIYYNERVIEGTVDQDAGAMIRDGIKSVASQGAPPESSWPYDITKFTVQPPPEAYVEAKGDLVSSYLAVNQDIQDMRDCLAQSYPIVLGFSVYDGFESPDVAQMGVANLPGPNETVIGGHCVVCVGYDDASGRFIGRNSWGTEWGQAGYFTIPYAYWTDPNLASDLWTIRSVTG